MRAKSIFKFLGVLALGLSGADGKNSYTTGRRLYGESPKNINLNGFTILPVDPNAEQGRFIHAKEIPSIPTKFPPLVLLRNLR